MGDISFLTNSSQQSPQSIEESLYQLENTSIVFLSAWIRMPQDLNRAARASSEAMAHLDHIVNEILRVRDYQKALGIYTSSPLEAQLNIDSAISASPVSREQQTALSQLGPGYGRLPFFGQPISLEKLLNKIKHRRPDIANFRVSNSGEHYFIIAIDKLNQQPDSIVEFIVGDFCNNCRNVNL